MLRTAAIAGFALLQTISAQAHAAAPDVDAYAVALAEAYTALEDGDAATARQKLSNTDRSMRGVGFKLLLQMATGDKPELTGRAVPRPDTRCILAVLHPAERQVAYLCDKGVVNLFDLTVTPAEPRKIVSLRGQPLMNGVFSGDGLVFAAGDAKGGVTCWDVKTWQEITTFVKDDAPVRYVAANHDGSKILAETKTGIVLWDRRRDEELGMVGERYRFGAALAFGSNGLCATGGLAKVSIFNADTGKRVREMAHAPYTMHLCFSDSGKYIASGLRGSLNKWLGVFDVATGEKVFDRARHEKGVTGLAFLDQDTRLLSTSADGTIKLWHVPSGKELLALRMGSSVYQPSVQRNGSVILWNQRSGPRYFLVE